MKIRYGRDSGGEEIAPSQYLNQGRLDRWKMHSEGWRWQEERATTFL